MTIRRHMPPEDREREAWLQRSSFVLGEYAGEHEATLKSFGLAQPIERGAVSEFLSAHDRRRAEDGHTIHDYGPIGVPFPDGGRRVFVKFPETQALVNEADRIADLLACEPGRVVEFLLTGRAFALPWIEVETRWTQLGPNFGLRVGSADVTAEEVRQAYVVAVRSALGDEGKRPLPSHVYPLIHKEAEGRLAGLTWNQRWQAWQEYARHWGITGHARDRAPGEEKTGYKNMGSYRNYVEKLRTRHEWIRAELERAEAEREYGVAEPETNAVQRSMKEAREAE